MNTAFTRRVGLIGATASFTLRCLRDMFRPPYDTREVFRHLDELGAQSLPVVGTTGLVVGLILAIQSRPVLARFGAAFVGVEIHTFGGGVDSIGHRNTWVEDGAMAGRRRSDRSLRGKQRSPGRPPVARQEHRRRFWALVAEGHSSEDAAMKVGVS
jgi:hypothetical protein